ncbi:unnamed protein product (macronuclear) [Paramecium tetraurelia]|uniref:Transmembrane protein n=1 Tax=Paramecium tetraurelia TaxID=5888 RepID=A0D3S0_PARTE|nr:uncharacterized protein GSPATT00039240001 [Paramecium tetraurelia]CAK77687.1 unnamed protein product [Paramecium tetraurelia]|eukprot:XP_001445084.1 hypothetical protein (macronuclear) [Paramecium tetraurelia strain d4-2]
MVNVLNHNNDCIICISQYMDKIVKYTSYSSFIYLIQLIFRLLKGISNLIKIAVFQINCLILIIDQSLSKYLHSQINTRIQYFVLQVKLKLKMFLPLFLNYSYKIIIMQSLENYQFELIKFKIFAYYQFNHLLRILLADLNPYYFILNTLIIKRKGQFINQIHGFKQIEQIT